MLVKHAPKFVVFALILVISLPLAAQPTALRNAKPAPAAATPAAANQLDNEAVAKTREQLFELLRNNPRITEILARDPQLLADRDFVTRQNPQLAQFLEQHPEVARNPEFYLFSRVGGLRYEYARGENEVESSRERTFRYVFNEVGPAILFMLVLGAALWLFSTLLENLRWKRTFKVQTELYNKMLDKFSSNEELLAYVRSDAGKRFLESAMLPIHQEHARSGMSLARVLIPLQLGTVLSLVGLGFTYLRSEFRDFGVLSVFGTLSLSLGIGFIISALLAWGIAVHLGIMPQRADADSGKGASVTAL